MPFDPDGVHSRFLRQGAKLRGRIRTPNRQGTVVSGDGVPGQKAGGDPDEDECQPGAQEVVHDDAEARRATYLIQTGDRVCRAGDDEA